MLALQANAVVSVETLVDAVWGEPAPARAEHTLQQHVSALRKAFGDSSALLTQSPGYRLEVAGLDADAFEQLVTEGAAAAARADWDAALAAFDHALALWRGVALADARDTTRLHAAAVRLDEKRLTTLEMRSEAALERGDTRCGRCRTRTPRVRVSAPRTAARAADDRVVPQWPAGRRAGRISRRAPGSHRGTRHRAGRGELRELEQQVLNQSPELESSGAPRAQAVDEVHATFKAGAAAHGRLVLPDGQAVLLTPGTLLIGRDPVAAVRLVDNRVSRRHAELVVTDGSCVLRDLGSTNGTTVNGASAPEHTLGDGDVISVGGVELRFGYTPDPANA